MPQINRLFCKPICKPDTARQPETGETYPMERDGICHVRRGCRTRERPPETAETHVVWLITQRSEVQILPPATNMQVRGPFRTWRGPLGLWFVNVALVHTVSRARASTVAAWSPPAEPTSPSGRSRSGP